MKIKLISTSLLPFLALTTAVAYTVKENIDLETTIGSNAEPNSNENTFYAEEPSTITFAEIKELFENESVYDYDGTPKQPKLKEGKVLPHDIKIEYRPVGGKPVPWPTNAGDEKKAINVYRITTSGGQTLLGVMTDKSITINQLPFPVTLPNKIVIGIGADGFVYNVIGDIPQEILDDGEIEYAINGVPAIDNIPKITDYGQYEVAGQHWGSVNYMPFEATSTVSVIHKIGNIVIDYDGNDNYNKIPQADLSNVPGVSIDKITVKNSQGTIVTEMIKAGVYTVEITYAYSDAESVTDTSTYTIKKEVYEAKAQISEVEYNGSEQTLGVDLSQLPAGVKIKAGSPVEVKGKNIGTYTATIQMDGGDVYEDFEVKVTLEVKQATISSITLKSKEVFYNGNTHTVVIEEVLPEEVKVTYSYSKDGTPIQGEPTDAGVYTVITTIVTGDNYTYTGVVPPVTLTIRKAKIEGLTLSRGEFDYAGVPHPLKINEELPLGTYVIYAYYENGQEIGTTAPYDAGDYIVKAIVDRGSNYEPLTLETELKINQVVPAVDPNEMEVVYTGEAITIELAKELSYEANIEYVNNVHTDAGTYQGKAIITGGRNYKDIEVELTLVIAKAPIEGLTLPGLPLVYDGQPKPLIVSGDVPEGVDLIYTYTDKDGNPIQGAPTDAGIYNVTVTVEDKNYYLEPVTATFEITKAKIEGLTLSRGEFDYAGVPHPLKINEELPPGTYVIYAYYENGQEIGTTAPYDAGDYIVKAIVDRGSNYEPLTLEAELKINQVVPAVDPNEMEVVYTGEAITIELAKELSYEANIEYVNNVHTDAGTYQGKAIITGGRNYKDIEVDLTLVITKAPIEGLTLPTTPVVYDGQPKSLVVEGTIPEAVKDKLKYTYTNEDGNPITGLPTNAGMYNVTVTVEDKNYYLEPVTATFEITKAKIEGLTLSRGEFDYAGVPHPLKINEELPPGTYVIYAYYENGQEIGTTAPYDAGDYIVKAIVDRGSNYEPLTLETELKINQVVPAVDPNEMEVVYTGEAITIELAKELSYEANIEYVNNVHTDAGTYQGKAIITGGRNYKDIEVELTLVIAKAPIEGLTLPGLPLVYDGQPKPLIVSGDVPEGVDLIYTYTDKDGNPIQGAPTDAGIYNVTVTVEDKNYALVPISTTFTIDKAVITGVSFADKTVTYDGTAQLLEVTGTLPTGVTVAYTDNSKTEAGQYDAVAVLTGGNNYVDQTLNAKLTIDKATITGVSFADKTVTYNGNPQEVKLEGVPSDFEVTYVYSKDGNPIQGAPTEAGDYTVEAIVKGGNNYEDKKFEAKVTISKAMIPNGTLEGKTVTYNGNPQEVKVEGVPSDFEVTYVYSKDGNPIQGAPTEAGDYTVEAIVKGGKNYEDKKFEAKVTISKAVIPNGTLEGKTVTYNGNPQEVKVEGVPSDFEVTYVYSKDGNPIQGAPTEAGDYTVEAIVKGGKNYEDKKFEAKVTIAKAVIPNGTLEGKTVTYNGNPQEVKVEGVPSDFEVTYVYSKDGNPIQGAPTEAGDYTVEAIVKGGKNYEDKKFEAKVTIAKAVIPNGTLEGKTVTYNGNPQEVKVEGVPSDFEVTYVYSKDGNPIQGAPTEAGDYTVEAIVKGGKNYEDKKFEAKVTIAKAVIPEGTLEGKTVTYNGNPQEVKVEGVPSDFEVTYVYSKDGNPIQGAPTEAGDYTVEAIVKGGKNYEDKKFEAKVTIAKAVIPEGILEGKTVTYDGTPQEVKVEGVPTDLVVEYTYKDKEGKTLTGAPTEAGDYTVEAIVKGGKNYEDKKFETTITIAKAVIPEGTLEGKTVTYDGTPQEVKVEGVPTDLVVEYTYKDKEGKTLTGAPTEAGEYTVEAIVKGGTNYEDKKFEAKVTISKAVIPNGTLESKTVTYDGTPQGVIVEGVPVDFTEIEYTYKDKEGKVLTEVPTEVGEYTVEAIVKGGTNYEDKKFEATVTIAKAVIPNGTLEGKTVTYNGNPQEVKVEGVPTDLVVEYNYKDKEGKTLTGAPTEAGDYTVEVIVKGGKNYEDKKFEAKVTISKAVIPNGTLESKTVTYNGNPQEVKVEGVPTDLVVEYNYKDKEGKTLTGAPTEAGDYTVEVIVKGGKNYEDKKFEAKVTISKAVIPNGTLESKTVTYDGTPQGVTVEGVPSDFEVTYVYSKDGNPLQGAPTDAGDYTVEAIVKGGANYEDKKFTTTVTISKAVIPNGTLESKTVTYNGNPQEVKLEGIPSDFEVTYVYSKDGQPIVGAPTEAGEYTVEAIVKGGKNYEDKKFEATVTISKAVIPNGTLESKTVTYDGTPQEVKVEGVPSDFEVAYVYSKDGNPLQGAPTDAGDYTVEAIVKGGTNYEDKKFEAKVTISKAVIPNGTLEGKTVTYDGNPQEVKVEGVPTDLVVEYTYKYKEGNPIQGAPTEAGDYTVEAIVKGGANYEDKKFTTTVKIAKAAISGVTFKGKETTYNGLTQRIEIVGELPKEASVSYETNEGVNAGEYLAKAIIKGGKNYEDLVLTTTLKINKANITGVSFIDKVVAYNKAEQVIEITGALPTGVTVVYEKAKQTEVGIYEAVARIIGGTNYNELRLTARFEIKEDRTPSKDAEIFELVINGVVYKKPGQVIEHMLRPTPYEDITDVDVVSFTEYSSLNVPEAFTVDTRDPKVYYKDITITSEDGKTSKTYTLKLIKPIEDRLIILQKFQNTLLINNNPSTNGGYAFVSYQWFRNGVVVSTKQSYSVGQAGVDKLNPNDYYYLIVKTTTGEEIYSTRIDIYEEQSKEIKLYPNPVSSSDMTTNIMVDYSAAQFEKGRVEILTPDGRFIYRQELTIGENRIVIPTQLSAGIYLAVVDINGKKQTIRFSVK